MKIVYKLSMILIVIGLCSSFSAGNFDVFKNKQEFTKAIKKDFSINPKGTTSLTNKYGKIEVKTWDKNRVKIDVKVIVKALSEDEAQKIFNQIDVDFSNDESFVKAETVFETNSSWWSSNWSSTNSDYEINYEVFLPATNELELSNKYGDVYVAKLENKGNITVKYGNFRLEGFANDVTINLGYGNGTIVKIKDADITSSYSKLRIKEARDLAIESKYSKLTIEQGAEIRSFSKYDTYDIGEIDIFKSQGKYDHIEIEKVRAVAAAAKYSDFVLQSLQHSADFDMQHGGVAINNLQKGFGQVRLVGRYTDYKIDVADDAAYTMAASGDYAGIGYPEHMTVSLKNDNGSYMEVKGFVGNANANSVLKASLDYGGLKIK